MAQRDWKFHDYDMLVNHLVRVHRDLVRYPVVYRLTNLNLGFVCLVYGGDGEDGLWERKTINGNGLASIRYASYASLDDALAAGIAWARRKDEEHASAI